MSEASSRLSELKKKLLSKAVKPSPVPVEASSVSQPAALPQPAIRPLVKVAPEEIPPQRESVSKKPPLTLRSLMGSKKKSSDSTSVPPPSGSRLKEAPAHRAAMLEESKTNIIKSKMISLNKPSSVADKIAHFEQNPPAGLMGVPVNPFAALTKPSETSSIFPIFAKPAETNPFASIAAAPAVETVVIIAAQVPDKSEDVVKFIQSQRSWLKRRVRETSLTYTNTKKIKSAEINIASFVQEHKRFLDALVAIK